MKKSGITTVLPIQRLRCRKCPSTFSCFYDFLVPYHRDSQGDLMTAIEHRLSRMEKGIGSQKQSDQIPASTVSRVFNRLLGNVGSALTKLQSLALKSGVNLFTVPPPAQVSAYGSQQKRIRLRLAVSLLNLAKHLYGRGEDVLKEVSALWSKEFQDRLKYASDRGPRLPRTHRVQYLLPCSILQSRFKPSLYCLRVS